MLKESLRVFTNMPNLHTKRLILRPMCADDASDMFEYASKPEVTRYLLWSPHAGISQTRGYLRQIERLYRRGEYYDWAITLKDGGKMIGTCGIAQFDLDNDGGEVGYVLNPAFHHSGYATEALGAVIRFCFSELFLHCISARIIDGNEPSMKVAMRCGMRQEAVHIKSLRVKGKFVTIHEFALLDEEYLGGKVLPRG